MSHDALNGWTEALGGREALSTIRNVYTRSRINAYGMTGTVEEWTTADGRWRQRLDLGGVYGSTRVYDPKRARAWRVDQNGQRQTLSGSEARQEVTHAFLGSFSHLLEGRMPGKVAVFHNERRPTIRVTPDGGLPVSYELDEQTNLPLLSSQPEGDLTRTIEFSDWRNVEGVSFPFHTRESSDVADSEIVTETEDIRLNGDLDATLFDAPEASPPDGGVLDASRARGIPLTLAWNHLFTDVRVNDSDALSFLIDTGAQLSVIEATAARRLGIRTQGQFQGRGAGASSTDAAFAAGVSFSLPGVEVPDQTVAVLDLADLFKFMGRRFDGILGYDFFSRFFIAIDYGATTMTVHNAESFDYTGSGEVVPMKFIGGIPSVRVRVKPIDRDPVEGNFLVDTGASDALFLTSVFATKNDLVATLSQSVRIKVPGVGGDSDQTVGRLEWVEFGGGRLEAPVTFFSHDTRGAFASPMFDGVVGAEILRRYRVLFDYARQRLILEPTVALNEPFDFDRSGLAVTAEGDGFDVFRVRDTSEGSPAQDAGIEVGDIIESIDGEPARALDLVGLAQRLRGGSRVIELGLRRGGELVNARLRLRRLV